MKWLAAIFAVFICAAAYAETVEISDRESLAIAQILLGGGDVESAEKIYAASLRSPDPEVVVESAFQIGNIAMARGDFESAIKYYYAIIKNNPAVARVRLELARAYFMNGDYQEAEFHFQFILAAPDLPPEVAEKIGAFLALIRQRKNWTLDFSFGIVPDSNLNVASGRVEECVDTIFGPFCRNLEEKKSGVGLRLNTEGNYYTRFSKRFGLRTTLGLSWLDFPAGRFDEQSLNIASGPRYAFDRGEVSMQPTASLRWYGGRFYNSGYGLRMDTNWQLADRLFAGAGASIRRNIYDGYAENVLGGYDAAVYLRPRYYLDDKSFLIGGIGFDQTSAKAEVYGYGGPTYSLGYFGEFRAGFSIFAQVGLTDAAYMAPDWFLMDGEFRQQTRRDLTWQLYGRVYNAKLEWHNLVPAISYAYILRDSNAPNYDFEKHRIELEIVRRF
ncbi:MAG: surface lipoprotein assembly modifier [Rickettsiales bacterium]|jgi:tetratricopeptide (TPR) repeat protein|nr:surface lipoprotein assembly modifier [Rickettsiales bacterium]